MLLLVLLLVLLVLVLVLLVLCPSSRLFWNWTANATNACVMEAWRDKECGTRHHILRKERERHCLCGCKNKSGDAGGLVIMRTEVVRQNFSHAFIT